MRHDPIWSFVFRLVSACHICNVSNGLTVRNMLQNEHLNDRYSGQMLFLFVPLLLTLLWFCSTTIICLFASHSISMNSSSPPAFFLIMISFSIAARSWWTILPGLLHLLASCSLCDRGSLYAPFPSWLSWWFLHLSRLFAGLSHSQRAFLNKFYNSYFKHFIGWGWEKDSEPSICHHNSYIWDCSRVDFLFLLRLKLILTIVMFSVAFHLSLLLQFALLNSMTDESAIWGWVM